MGYTKDAIKGISWSVALRGYTRLLSVLRVIVIARFFLSPYEFGLFSIVTLVLSFLEILTETGINVFLIQEKNPVQAYVNSAWTVSIIRGIVISVLLGVCSYGVGIFFRSPAVVPLLLTASIIPFIRGFINPSEVVFQKELYFHKEFIFRSVLITIETFFVVMLAMLLKNAYCFVIGMMMSAASEVVLSFVFISPKPKLELAWEKIRHIFHRGKWVTLYGIFQYFAGNIDNIVVGRLLNVSSLAIYQNAYTISILPVSEVGDVINKVVFPIFVKIEHERKRLLMAFLKLGGVMILGSVIVGAIIFFFPKQLILLTFGQKWIGAVSILPILAIYGLVRAIFGYATTLFLAVKKQEYVTHMIFARFVVLAATIVPFTHMWGLTGAAYSALLSGLIEIPISLFYTFRVFKS